MTYTEVIALTPVSSVEDGTSLDHAKNFAPGTRTVIIWYGRIPGYRSKESWGFAISDPSATDGWYQHYACARKSAKRIFGILKHRANERGFKVKFQREAKCGLSADLSAII